MKVNLDNDMSDYAVYEQSQGKQFRDCVKRMLGDDASTSALRKAFNYISFKLVSLYGKAELYSPDLQQGTSVIGMTVYFSPLKRIYVAFSPTERKVTVNYLDSDISPINFYSKEFVFNNDKEDIKKTSIYVVSVLSKAGEYFYRNQCIAEDSTKPFNKGTTLYV